MVLGIVSLLSCGGFGVGAIAAIVCGHMALSSIGKSGGRLGGRGMAVTGLVIGYASILLVVVALAASLFVPALAKMGEKGQVVRGIADARMTAIGIRLYAADRQGKYPPTLDELVTSHALKKDVLDRLESFKPAGWQGEPGFEYRGANMTDTSAGGMILLISRCQDARGKRVVATNDSSVELKSASSP